jgi:hypothetical protein
MLRFRSCNTGTLLKEYYALHIFKIVQMQIVKTYTSASTHVVCTFNASQSESYKNYGNTA